MVLMFLLKDRCHLNMVLILHQMSKHLATMDLKPQAVAVTVKTLHHKVLEVTVAGKVQALLHKPLATDNNHKHQAEMVEIHKPQAVAVTEILKHQVATAEAHKTLVVMVATVVTAVLKVLHHKALVLMVAEMAGKALSKATEVRMTAEVKVVLVLVNQLKHLRQNLKKST